MSTVLVLGFSAFFATSLVVWPRKTFKVCLWFLLFVGIVLMLANSVGPRHFGG